MGLLYSWHNSSFQWEAGENNPSVSHGLTHYCWDRVTSKEK